MAGAASFIWAPVGECRMDFKNGSVGIWRRALAPGLTTAARRSLNALSILDLQSPIIMVDSPSTWSCCLTSCGSLPSAFMASSFSVSVFTSCSYMASSFLTRVMTPVLILSALRASLLSAMVSRDVCVVERRASGCATGYAVALGRLARAVVCVDLGTWLRAAR